MVAQWLPEKEEVEKLYLSPSAAAKYDDCPRKYRFYYEEEWRTRATALALPFGSAVHKAIANFFIADYKGQHIFMPDDFEEAFERSLQGLDLKPHRTWTKEKLIATGRSLCAQFPQYWDATDLAPVIDQAGPVVERKYVRSIGNGVVLRGFIDVMAIDWQGVSFLIDWKTPAVASPIEFLENSDQMTEYQLGGDAYADEWGIGQVDKLAIGELIKRQVTERSRKGPTIEPLKIVSRRTDDEIAEFIQSRQYLATDIRQRRFNKRARMPHNSPCKMCDFVQLCIYGDISGLVTRSELKKERREQEEFEELYGDAFTL